MQHIRLIRVATITVAAFAALALLGGNLTPVGTAFAQGSNQQWFVPGQGGGQGGGQARPSGTTRPPTRPAPATPQAGAEQEEEQQPPMQVQLPPMPAVPDVPRGTSPPAAVMGTFGFRDVLRASTAVQQLERTLGERRDRLNQDVQKEQNAWREQQQQLAKQRSTMNPEQIRNKERELQERVTKAQREFRDRSRILQESYQYGAAQVERVTGEILRKVAESRGMNLVLPREQIPLSAADFDITDEVIEHLNKTITSVVIPPENVPLSKFAPAQAKPSDNGKPAAGPAASGKATPPSPAAPAPKR